MSRRIQTGRQGGLEGAVPSSANQSADDYLGRLSKYVPAEIVGLYLATVGMVPLGPNGSLRCAATWVVFALNALLVPLYFWFVTTRDHAKPLIPQIVLASIAFPVWVFAIGGPFKCFRWYESWIAAITLAFTTVGMGFVRPRPGS
jgi:hypothetical protein